MEGVMKKLLLTVLIYVVSILSKSAGSELNLWVMKANDWRMPVLMVPGLHLDDAVGHVAMNSGSRRVLAADTLPSPWIINGEWGVASESPGDILIYIGVLGTVAAPIYGLSY